jgi:hypothetical protein
MKVKKEIKEEEKRVKVKKEEAIAAAKAANRASHTE